jgi:hypothetical protein
MKLQAWSKLGAKFLKQKFKMSKFNQNASQQLFNRCKYKNAAALASSFLILSIASHRSL